MVSSIFPRKPSEVVLNDYREACKRYHDTLRVAEKEHGSESLAFEIIRKHAQEDFTKARHEYFEFRRNLKYKR